MVIFEYKNHVLFTGDTIFENTYGRTDLASGSHDEMEKSLNHLFGKFYGAICFSGHGNEFNIDDVKRKINLLFAYKG